MSNSLQRTELCIRSFYIFNTTYGQRDGEEHEKILYYYPKEIELDTKIKDVGLSEALTSFTDTFTDDKGGCEVVHTKKTTQFFYQCEPNFWIVLTLNVAKEYKKSKDGMEYTDYRNAEIHNEVYKDILQQCYNMFVMENGTFEMINEAHLGDYGDFLINLLNTFYDKYILILKRKLPVKDLSHFLHYVRYLPLDKPNFLNLHNLLALLKGTFTQVKDTVFLFRDSIVSTGKLQPTEMRSFYEVMVTLLEIDKECDLENEDDTPLCVRQIYLKDDEGQQLKLVKYIIFSVNNASLCVILDEVSDELLEELRNFINPRLYKIASSIFVYASIQPVSTAPKYLFINEQSLRHKTNIEIEPVRSTRTQGLPTSVINLVADFSTSHSTTNPEAPDFEEILVKSTDDFWIVKRHSNWRQYFVIIFNKKATLLDVTKEAEKIFEYEIKDDVFFES